jgi:histidyl-tRNA synthetase
MKLPNFDGSLPAKSGYAVPSMALTGFRDFYPADCAQRNALFATWRQAVSRYGFVEYDGPPLEPLELFTKKSGSELTSQLYNFTDKGEREVTLRPEMTPTLARLVAARHRNFKKPLKWFSIPQVFRYERPQEGRLREHFQLNCDIVGEAGLQADIELIALVIDTLRAFGLTAADFVVRLSDRQFWTAFMDTHQVPEAERYNFLQIIDKSERVSEDETRKKLGPLADPVFSVLKDGADWEPLQKIEAGLADRGFSKYVKRDFTIVRGIAYYTGPVWEVFDRAGQFRAIAAGGRYDDLLLKLGDVDMPALGFGMGDVVLAKILQARNLTPASTAANGLYVVIPDLAHQSAALKLVQVLRDAKLGPVEFPFAPMKMGKQFQAAEERGARWALIVDNETLTNKTVGVKNLVTRQQEPVSLEEVVSWLRSQMHI